MRLEKIEAEHGVVQGTTARCIDTEDLGAARALKEVRDEVLGELLAQILADHIALRAGAHVQLLRPVPVETMIRQVVRVCISLTRSAMKAGELSAADRSLEDSVRLGSARGSCQAERSGTGPAGR